MTQAPKISVLIPCFNAAPYIGQALESVLSQGWPNLEVIVVNDGSTDGSQEVLARYTAQGVTLINQENAGQCAAANRALAASTGDLIKFFDADDVLLPGMLSLQAERLGGRTDAIAMGEWSRFYNDPYSIQFERLQGFRDATPIDWLASEWAGGQPMMQCAMWLIPRKIIETAGQWDERLTLINDFEYFSRVLLAAEDILFTPGARLAYRSGLPGSLSGLKSRKGVESQALSLLLGTQHLLESEDTPRTRRSCANMLKAFDYEHYPRHSGLRAKLVRRAKELGGAHIDPIGPPRFQSLRRIMGWRMARRIQNFGDLLRGRSRMERSG